MVIFFAVGLPIVAVLIVAIVVITLSLNTVKAGKMCVTLNKKNESVNDKVYLEGTHLISPLNHFSAGLPTKEAPMSAGVYTQSSEVPDGVLNTTTELSVYVVFRFYVEQDNAYDYFRALGKNFSSEDYEIETAFNKNASEVVKNILGKYSCAQYNEGKDDEAAHEKKWIQTFTKDCKEQFAKNGERFSLDASVPIKAIMFFDGCAFEHW